MANTIRFYDGYVYDGYNYHGRIVVHVDSFSYSPTDLNEVQVPVDVPAGPYAGQIFILYFDLADPTDPTVVTGGFTFDSASPPAWVASWSLLSNTYSQNPPWDLEPTRDVELFDGSWTSVDSGFAVSVDAASDANWYQPPPAPTVTGFTPASCWTGQTVTVTGTGFTTASNVTVAGNAVTFTIVDDSTLTFTAGLYGGTIEVTNPTGFDDSATGLVLNPWVKQLGTTATNVSESVTSTLVAAKLTDAATLIAYGTRIRRLSTGATTVTADTAVTFDVDAAGNLAITRLDATHALLIWTHAGPITNVTRMAVITDGSPPTVGTTYDVPTGDPDPAGDLVRGLSGGLAVTSSGVLIAVSGTTITGTSLVTGWATAFTSGVVEDIVPLSATSALVGWVDLTTGYFTRVDDIDTTPVYSSAASHTGSGEQPINWLLPSGRAVQWEEGFDFWTVDPAGPTIEAVGLGGNAAMSGVNARTPAALTDDISLIIQAYVGSPGAATLLIYVDATTALDTKAPPLDLTDVDTSGAVSMIGLAARVLLIGPDPTTGFAAALLLAPDVPTPVGGWSVGAVLIG